MSWHFSQALEAEYLQANCLDGKRSARSNTRNTQGNCLKQDRTMDVSTCSQSGTTLPPSTACRGKDVLTWFLGVFPVRTSARRTTKRKGLAVSDPASGQKWRELYLKCNRDGYSLKTLQCLWDEDLPWSCVTLPKWGMMRSGELWELDTSAIPICVNGVGYMPTILKTQILEKTDPIAVGQVKANHQTGYVQKTSKNGKDGSAPWPLWMLYHGFLPTPKAAECFMGFPEGWTDLQGSAMLKFRQWLRKRGKFLSNYTLKNEKTNTTNDDGTPKLTHAKRWVQRLALSPMTRNR